MKIDMTKKNFDWEKIPEELRKLQRHMDNSINEVWDRDSGNGEFDEWAERHPITLGFGHYTLVVPMCAASFNVLSGCLKDMADEFEA